jgi:carboxymethylenebutenolidase
LHEAYGLNDDIRSHADHLASEGYVALAPDLYSRAGPARCLARTMTALSRGRGRPFDDIEPCRLWLTHHERCTGRVGIVGFCMGGGFANACASTGRYGAAAPTTARSPEMPGPP